MVFSQKFSVPKSLLIYDVLKVRKRLTPLEKQQYERLQKGFAGEKRLMEFVTDGKYENLIALYNCLFELERTEFQIDCLLLTTDTIFLLEVKNYSNDYLMEDGKIYNFATKREIYNPITQLERTEHLFKNLLNRIGVNIKVRSYVVFINPSFMLYGAIPHLSMVFPMQVHRFLMKLNANASRLTDRSLRLAKTLASRRKHKSTYEQLPEFDLSDLKKGVFCEFCSRRLSRKERLYFVCNQCDKCWTLNEVLLFSIAQFNLLFPDLNIRTNTIYEWCNRELSTTYIRNTMKKHFKTINNGSYTYYELPEHFAINNLSRRMNNI